MCALCSRVYIKPINLGTHGVPDFNKLAVILNTICIQPLKRAHVCNDAKWHGSAIRLCGALHRAWAAHTQTHSHMWWKISNVNLWVCTLCSCTMGSCARAPPHTSHGVGNGIYALKSMCVMCNLSSRNGTQKLPYNINGPNGRHARWWWYSDELDVFVMSFCCCFFFGLEPIYFWDSCDSIWRRVLCCWLVKMRNLMHSLQWWTQFVVRPG